MKHELTCRLLPSGDELRGAVPDKFSNIHRFQALRGSFFPEPQEGVISSPCWSAFFQYGYMRDFHRAIWKSNDQGTSLRDALDGIIMNLQILPYNPGRPTHQTAPLWRCRNAVVDLLVNASYVQLADRTIKQGEGEARGQGYKKPTTGRLLGKMIRGNGFGPPRPKKSGVHRRGKSLNWRVPPKPRKRRRVSESGDDEDSDGSEIPD